MSFLSFLSFSLSLFLFFPQDMFFCFCFLLLSSIFFLLFFSSFAFLFVVFPFFEKFFRVLKTNQKVKSFLNVTKISKVEKVMFGKTSRPGHLTCHNM